MTYLAFLIAVGSYAALGPGGPLHRDEWFHTLRQRVDAIEPHFWLGFALIVVLPCVVMMLLYSFLAGIFGGAAMLLVGSCALFFALGRVDLSVITNRFVSRADAGDFEGALLVLEEAGAALEVADEEALGASAARIVVYEGFQRWFPPVFYFFLLGPFAAVAYRLVQLGATDKRVPVGSLRHLFDWLPSRALLLTFAIVGSFDDARKLSIDRALDPEIETDQLLLEGLELAMPGADGKPSDRVRRVGQALQRSQLVWLALLSVMAIIG